MANQADQNESKDALSLFADIIRVRQYDTSRIMAILSPNDPGDVEGNNEIDLAQLDCSKETDFFMLKFLLCNAQNESSSKKQDNSQ